MRPELSVVATLYMSSPHIEEFYQRIVACCKKLTDSFELILVNDGSPDDSLAKAKALTQLDHRLKVVDLSRNFGHHKAIMTGLAHSRGNRVFVIDSDLEEPPEVLLQFSELLNKESDMDMIYGVQQKRKGGIFERISGDLFYKVVNALVDYPIPNNFLTVRLMTRRFVDELCRYEERELNFATLISMCGFESKAVVVQKGARGQTTYTLSMKLQILANTIASASSKPLWMIFVLGVMITSLSVLAISYILVRQLLYDISVAGWTSLMISIWFIGGVLILSLGIIGIYVSKIFVEVKQRPYVNIREIVQQLERDDHP